MLKLMLQTEATTMNKYKNIDCVIINETELRHELEIKIVK